MATTEKKRFKKVRLHKVAKELNLTVDTIVDHLEEHGHGGVLSGKGINAAITDEEAYLDLLDYFADDLHTRERVQELRSARQAELAAAIAELRFQDLLSGLGDLPQDWLELTSSEDGALMPGSRRVVDALTDGGRRISAQAVTGDAFWSIQEITLAPNLVTATEGLVAP